MVSEPRVTLDALKSRNKKGTEGVCFSAFYREMSETVARPARVYESLLCFLSSS
jgi:hypothetical protein